MWESVCMCVRICVQTIINDLWLHKPSTKQNKTKPSKQTKKEKYSQRWVVEPD